MVGLKWKRRSNDKCNKVITNETIINEWMIDWIEIWQWMVSIFYYWCFDFNAFIFRNINYVRGRGRRSIRSFILIFNEESILNYFESLRRQATRLLLIRKSKFGATYRNGQKGVEKGKHLLKPLYQQRSNKNHGLDLKEVWSNWK